MSNPIWLSIVVPVHIGGTTFEPCISALSKLIGSGVELIVVADGEGDGAWRIIQRYDARVYHIAGPSGPAKARNYGASMAQGHILYFVDADVVVHSDVIEKLRGLFDDPSLTAVIGSYDTMPADPHFLSQYRNLLHHYVHQTGEDNASTFWGACGAIRRGAFLEAGGFDERYTQPAIEDIALGYTLRKLGHRIRLEKRLLVTHLKRWTLIGMIKTDLFQRAIPWTRLLMAERKLVNDLNLRTSSRASVVLAYLTVISALAAVWQPFALIGAAMALAVLIFLNRDVYRFFGQVRGISFALRVIPFHVLYYLYSGLGFAIGTLIYVLRDSRQPNADSPISITQD